MSSVGQVVGGAVGAVVGFFTPIGPMYGAQIGMMIGGYLDPVKGPNTQGPRLTDLTQQTSTYGAVIPRGYGTFPVVGNVFWLENNRLKEVSKKKKSGGKGGSSSTSTTYSYYATCAIGICEGPITAVKRIWVGAKLIYDAGSNDQGAIMASNQASTLFTLYTGTEDQLPDERMQATLGVANTPAYRGLAYIVLKDYPLADHGNSLVGAQVKFEVVSKGAVSTYVGTNRTGSGASIWRKIEWCGSQFVAIGFLPTKIETSPDGVTWTVRNVPTALDPYCIAYGGSTIVVLVGSGFAMVSTDAINWRVISMPASIVYNTIVWNGKFFLAGNEGGTTFAKSYDGIAWTNTGGYPEGSIFNMLKWNGEKFLAFGSSGSYAVSKDGQIWQSGSLPAATWQGLCWGADKWIIYAGGTGKVYWSYDGLAWNSYTPAFSVAGKTLWDGENFVSLTNNWEFYISRDGLNWAEKSLWPNSYSFQDVAWNGAVICGITAGASISTIRKTVLSNGTTALSEVVQSEILLSNLLSSGDIDVSGLAQTVRGYRISSVSAIRSSVEPLRGAWPFDVIQKGYQVVCKPRGGSSMVTVPSADLGARGAGDQAGISITNVREMDSVLPVRVSLKYLDYDREFDVGEQYAERLNTDAVNVETIDIALVMTSGEAAKNAEMLLYQRWLDRSDVAFSLPSAYLYLEPGDVITINADEASYVLRLTEITYTQDDRLECSAKYHSAAIYSMTALGETGKATGASLSVSGGSRCQLLDIPLLLDANDTAGFPVAMTGEFSGWKGGVLYRSDDSGQTWVDVQSFTAPGSVIGSCGSPIGAGRTDIIDSSSILSVALIRGELSSVSELAMLNGANHFAYGTHGRWEIIAAKNCVLQADGTYLLSDLLRGRFGTEWARGLHASADSIVLLDSSALEFVGMNINQIGLSRTYRGITAGLTMDSAADFNFSYNGVNLECLSPVYAKGSRNPTTGDWLIEWMRRTRTGGEWRDYVDASIGETAEAYEVDIFSDSSLSAVKRTIASSSASIIYEAGQQANDFSDTPINVALTNPGAEAGNTSGWTNELGVLTVQSVAQAHSGFYYFMGGATAEMIARQRVDLVASGLLGADIDSGFCSASLSCWLAGWDGDADTARIGIRFLNSVLGTISETYIDAADYTQTWVLKSLANAVPVNARYADVLLRAMRVAGTNNDGYFDDVSLALYKGQVQDTIYAKIYQVSNSVGRGYPLTATLQK